MVDTVSIKLPFEGFYESKYSGEVDHIEEREAEWLAEREAEEGIAPELRLEASEFSQFLFDCANYGKCYQSIARVYVDAFENVAEDLLGFKLGLSFEEMTSPKFYNFETDRLFARIPVQSVQALLAISAADDHTALGQVIEERHTSRSGFHSFYSNVLEEWLEKPLEDWDHNELESLLLACIALKTDKYDESLDWQVYSAATDCDGFYHEYQECVDWRKFDALVEERRAELVEEQRALDPDYVAPPVRCPDTLDLFANL